MTRSNLTSGAVLLTLVALWACDTQRALLDPSQPQNSVVAPYCFGRRATIYPGNPSNPPGAIVDNGDGTFTILGTPGPDVIVGTSDPDDINGQGGNDRICSGDGDDLFLASAGAESFNGGDGADLVSYLTSPSGVMVKLLSNGTGGDAEGDRYLNVESAQGSAFDDDLRGTPSPNVLMGGAGADVLWGRGGVDVLFGDGGDDALYGEAGNDYIDGGEDNDVLHPGADVDEVYGGDGTDRVSYASAPSRVSVSLGSNGSAGEANGDSYADIENATGSKFDDMLEGTASANVLDGLAGADTVRGLDGNDQLFGRAGADELDGGSDADVLVGNDGFDDLDGGAGDDSLFPGAGANAVDGGPDNDTATTGSCIDTITNVETIITARCAERADAAQSVISAAASEIDADGGTSVTTITVQLKNSAGANLTVGGNAVELTTDAGTLTDGTTTATTLAALDQGDGTYTLTLKSSSDLETATITGTVETVAITDDVQVDFVAGPVHHFIVTGTDGNAIPQQEAGVSFNIKIVAKDVANHTATDFTGTVAMTSTPGGPVPEGATTAAFTAGVLASHTVRIDSGDNYTLTATNTEPGAESGTSASFVVTEGPDASENEVTGTSVPSDPYHSAYNAAVTVVDGALDLLANDDLGFPAAALTYFGAVQCNNGSGTLNDATDAVDANAAGSTQDLSAVAGCGAGSSLVVNADGTLTFTPSSTYTGLFRFQYRIENASGMSDAQVTLAVGVRPAANADTYSGGSLIGNVSLNTAAGTAFSVKTNDAGDNITLAEGLETGGAFTLNASTGTFTYDPAPAHTGAASLAYTVTNGFGTVGTSVGLTVSSDRIWYVDLSVGTNGNGTQLAPFKNLSDIASVNGDGAANHPKNNDVIFIAQNATAYVGALALRSGQKLFGEDAGATIQATLSPAYAPAAHQTMPVMQSGDATIVKLTSASATILTLGNGNRLRGFTLGNALSEALLGTNFGTLTLHDDVHIDSNTRAMSLSNGILAGDFASVTSTGGGNNIRLAGITGTSDMGSGALSGASSNAFQIGGANATITYAGSITNSTARAVSIQSVEGGSVTLSGDISSTGNGVVLALNSGGTITLSGASKVISTTTATALNLTNSGTAVINITNGGLAVTTTTGAAVHADGSGGTINIEGPNNTIATTGGLALNIEDMSIGANGITFQSIDASGGTNGIRLVNTGSAGGLTITGTGAAGTGGTVTGMTGDNIFLSGTTNPSFSFMNIQNSQASGIYGTNVTGFKLKNSTVSANGNAVGEAGIEFDGLLGTDTITGSTVTGSAEDNLVVRNASGTLDSLVVTNSTFSSNSSLGGDGILLTAANTANATIRMRNNTFTANRGDHFQATASNAAILNVVFFQNTLSGGHATALGQGITLGTGLTFTGTFTYDINDNDITDGPISNAITIDHDGTTGSLMQGRVRNNVIGTAGVDLTCSAQASGIEIENGNAGTHTYRVSGNTITRCYDRGIFLDNGDGSNVVVNATVTGNTVDGLVTANARQALYVNVGSFDPNFLGTTDSFTVCADIENNTLTPHPSFVTEAIRLRMRFDSRMNLAGYTGSFNNAAAEVHTYLAGRNTLNGGVNATTTATGAPYGYYNAGASCPTPP